MRTLLAVSLVMFGLLGCSGKPETNTPATIPVTTKPAEAKVVAPTYAGEWRLAITADGKDADASLTIMPDGSFEQELQSQGKKVSLAGKLSAEQVSIPGKTVTALDLVVSMVDGGEVPPSDPIRLTYEKEFDTLTDTALAVWVRPDKLEATRAAQKK